MSLAVANAKLIGRKLKCAVLIIHHPGKDVDRGSRGHSSLLGDIDAEWRITRNGEDRVCKLKVTKQKDGEYGQEFYFAATSIPLGIYDEDNEEIFSLALSPVKSPGESIPTYVADRISIISAMEIGEKTSTTQLAARCAQTFGARSAAIERINAAVPTEWVRVRKGERVVELKRTVASKKGRPNTVEMRLAASEQERAEGPSTICSP